MGNIGYETGGIDISGLLMLIIFGGAYLYIGFLKIKEWWNERHAEQIKMHNEIKAKHNEKVRQDMRDGKCEMYNRMMRRARPIMQTTTTAGEPCHLTEQDYKRSK